MCRGLKRGMSAWRRRTRLLFAAVGAVSRRREEADDFCDVLVRWRYGKSHPVKSPLLPERTFSCFPNFKMDKVELRGNTTLRSPARNSSADVLYALEMISFGQGRATRSLNLMKARLGCCREANDL